VIAVDTNLLVYAHRRDSAWHDRASGALRQLAEGKDAWAIPWPCIHEFLAIVTHPRIYNPPTPLSDALNQVDAWLESPNLHMLAEIRGYWQVSRGVLENARVSAALVHDARVAALCIQHGVDLLWTADRDFSRFAGLNVSNPLLQ
jgi:toxin-antitoxin system PIN domain toxin